MSNTPICAHSTTKALSKGNDRSQTERLIIGCDPRRTPARASWYHRTAKEYPTTHKVHYLTSERAVNDVLRAIQDGVIGFDTEYKHRDPTVDEVVIEHLFANVPGSKRSGLLVWQVLQTKHGERFDIKWDNIGLCVVQIARGDDVWTDTALPQELERVLESHDITKAGVGIAADLGVVWNDLGCNINNAVDCGLMAKLKDPHRYKNGPFANLSLEQSVSDVLGFDITKDLQKSNWKGDANGDIHRKQTPQ